MSRKRKKIVLSNDDRLSMFRCAFLTSMGVAAGENQPTDTQCIQWLQRLMQQALGRVDTPITLIPHEPVKRKLGKVVPEVTIRQWDAVILPPEWRDLPCA